MVSTYLESIKDMSAFNLLTYIPFCCQEFLDMKDPIKSPTTRKDAAMMGVQIFKLFLFSIFQCNYITKFNLNTGSFEQIQTIGKTIGLTINDTCNACLNNQFGT